MLRPEEMTRAVVVGSIDSLDATIECLYELGVLHLIDFTSQDEEFKIGQPLPKASGASQKLLKLRAMIRSLELEKHRPSDKMQVRDINKKLDQAFVTLDLNTSSKAEARQKIQALIREKEAEIQALEPIATFGVKVEDYDGYDNLVSFTGTCRFDPEHAISSKLQQYEIFKLERKADFVVALFVKSEDRMEAARLLSEHDYQEIKLPKLKGDPEHIIEGHRGHIKDLEADLKRVESDLEGIRKQFADFIISSEEHLSIEVLKAETPLRIATSANSFVIDGWIPTARADEIQTALNSLCGGLAFVETIPPEREEEPPVKLKNPKPVRPFEFFINLVSTPKYEEIDPTLILFITFPVFFGFMIGDLGFGLSLMALGAFMRWKLKNYPDLYKLGAIVLAGGLLASIFGIFVFAEAFGVPFHPAEGSHEEASWEAVVNIPVHPMLEKMHDVLEMLAISLVAGWLHLTLGFAFGFVNHVKHSKKHALAKVMWLLLLFGMFAELMTIGGDATETSKFFNSTLLAPLPDETTNLAGIVVSLPALGFILVGLAGLPFTEGPAALSEVVGLFTNLVSYARLAALSVGKGAMAFAFNSMLFPLIFDSGNILISIAGVATLFVVQGFFVFFLGALSSGIQAIRLNYVEFFLKFFEGGGADFEPLSYERKHSTATK
ncbi:MAG: V-type ATP synthase subunit I [Candidatus Thermoplasmatota archaeon]|nr:V-type ATP synthase subunit I [Candidatus Thermoplasmatota archaeon]